MLENKTEIENSGLFKDYQEVLRDLERHVSVYGGIRFNDKIGLSIAKQNINPNVIKGDLLVYQQEETIGGVSYNTYRKLNGDRVGVNWNGSFYKVRKIEEYELEKHLREADFSEFTLYPRLRSLSYNQIKVLDDALERSFERYQRRKRLGY